VGELINTAWNSKLYELVRSWNQREEIRILHGELLLVDTIQTQRVHRQVFTDALVKNSITTANHRLRLLATR